MNLVHITLTCPCKCRFPFRRIQPRDQVTGLSGHAQLEIQAESERFTGERAVSSGSWIKFNFFATRMSENQADCFFSMLEHAIVPVRATKFAEVETGLKSWEKAK